MKIVMMLMTLFLHACTVNKDSVKIEQQDSNYPVVVAADDSLNKVLVVYCYLVYNVQKSVLNKVRFYEPDQYENSNYSCNKERWRGRFLISDEYGDLRAIEPNDPRKMLSCKKTQYLVKTASPIDTSFAVQEIFLPYLERMRAEGKDTIHIGSIQQLKCTNPDLINNLLQRDSMEFVFGRDERRHSIRMPIEVR